MAGKRQTTIIRAAVTGLAMLAVPSLTHAQNTSKNYDEIYYQYLAAARKLPPPSELWMTDLASDLRARRQGDLVTIRVLESLSATGAADSSVNKKGEANATLPGKAGEYLGKVFPGSSETKFNGSGNTTRTTELTATITARVVEVLPSGDLVVEGIREVDINGDRNVVVLTGVIRATDIQPGNVIPSTRVGQLRIRSLSQGLIKDSLTPGWLIRMLNKVF
jgi:flagellar L-ring protein FlgH